MTVAGLISSEAGPAAGTESEKKGKLFLSSNIKSCTAVHTPSHTMSRALQIDKMVWATKRATPTLLCVCATTFQSTDVASDYFFFFCSREIIAFFVLLLLHSADIFLCSVAVLKINIGTC